MRVDDKYLSHDNDGFYMGVTYVRMFDTKRTVFIKDGKVKIDSDERLNSELIKNNVPVFVTKDSAEGGETGAPPESTLLKLYPEKGKVIDYTSKVVEIANKISTKGRKLVLSSAATSYGYVNNNFRYYHLDSIKKNARTFYEPNPVPFLTDHNDGDSRSTIGRVFYAHPVYYDVPKSQLNNIDIPKAYIKTYSIITDSDAIDRILSLRYLTISSGFRAKYDEVTCSICGTPLTEGCEHEPGNYYDKKLAYMICHTMRYTDESFVNNPADLWSRSIAWEYLDPYVGNGVIASRVDENTLKKMVDEHRAEFIEPNLTGNDVSLYVVDPSSPKTVVDMYSLDETKFEQIFDDNNNKWECINDVCKFVSSDSDDEYMEDNCASDGGVTLKDSNDNDKIKSEEAHSESSNLDSEGEEEDGCTSCSESDNGEEQANKDLDNNNDVNANFEDEENDMLESISVLNIIQGLLDDNKIKSEDAIELLKSSGIPVIVDNNTVVSEKRLSELIDECLDRIAPEVDEPTGDRVLTTRARKNLPKSAFCGPGRSWPVPDCRHVATARAYLKNPRVTRKYSSSQLAKIRACVERKAKALGCDKNKKK